MWLYTKGDALKIVKDTNGRKAIHNEDPNVLFLSTHFDEISPETIVSPIALVHRSTEVGFYGRILSSPQLKNVRLFKFDKELDTNGANPKLRTLDLTPFDSVNAGIEFPQPSTASVEQLRSRIGECFWRMKPSTGGHKCSSIIDADFAAFVDLVYAVPHTRTPATVRIVCPTRESLGVLCQEECLCK
eukprot:4936897-Pyramimonas_sp.AAC.1